MFGTCKEKDFDLHKKFNGPARKRKVRKEVEELAKQIGISKEAMQRAREKNILKEEDMEKPKKSKFISTPPKQSKPKQSQPTPTFDVQKFVPPPKSQSTSTGGAGKRKKEKPTRKYITTKEETETDEKVGEVKKTTTYARLVRKPQTGGAQSTKKPRAEAKSSEKARESKKQKSKLDEALKFRKVQGTYEVVPRMTLKQIIDEILKDGNLKNVPVIDVNLTHDDSHPREQSHDTSILEVHKVVLDKQKDQSFEKAILEEKPKVQITVDDPVDNVDDSDEDVQDPLVIEVVSEKIAKETDDTDKDKDDGEKGEKDESAKVAKKEKGEEKTDQVLVTMAGDTVAGKGKQIATN
ncbi:uncharacterized protein LOC131873950 [Cryptomeria japonica]|uniref:uncharacterized protein LOC131873950 n=1 Tax=Cryptomeria japonica TaxID=3369 RepID=UPI0027DA3448|nr:uncharacterized protein LOC131873950 [Cryptomeria japonica]